MTLILNSPETFAAESLAGFVAANATRVRPAPGGVVRSTVRTPGKVAVVVGGGSGHYPAFAGVVGEGLADGAVCGDVFASPSTRQVMDICRAVDQGAGVWLSFGNYAGDVLNFSAAATRLRAQGMRVALLAVTDDVASASAAERHRRRGVAGDLVVFKVAGAAAEAGYDLDAVEAVAARANDRTRSFGAAFDGCTLPGAEAPLFTLPEGTIAWGLGVHGEPGVGEGELPSADELAAELVRRVLEDAPADGGSRVAVLLNGLGSVKYEELFVLWSAVLPLLEAAGLDVVAPEVGELVTSLDMAGCSLTVSWLDDELERLWLAPADSPAFRRTLPAALDPTPVPVGAALPAVEASTEVGQQAGVCVRQAVEAVAALLRDLEDELGRLDAVAGDGDHGRGMARGSAAALAGATAASDGRRGRPDRAAARRRGVGRQGRRHLRGPLGRGAARGRRRLPSDAVPTDADVVAAVVNAWQQVKAIGGAEVGDKTLVDALEPFAVTLQERFDAGDDLETAWATAVSAAQSAAAATADIAARMGRSRVLGAKSLGSPDPGATSLAAVMGALAPVVTRRHAASLS